MKNKLIGKWISYPEHNETIKTFGRITLEFTDDGRLNYTIHNEDKDQIILLSYKIEDDVIITDQPSKPQIEKTSFSITSDGKLVLSHGVKKSRYVKEK